MSKAHKQPIRDVDTDELLGYIQFTAGSWTAETTFGYALARVTNEQSAREIVASQGKRALRALWRYFDGEDNDWYPCIISEAHENRVVVTRTNELGFQTSETFKRVIIKSPSETNFQLA